MRNPLKPLIPGIKCQEILSSQDINQLRAGSVNHGLQGFGSVGVSFAGEDFAVGLWLGWLVRESEGVCMCYRGEMGGFVAWGSAAVYHVAGCGQGLVAGEE